MKVVKIQIHDEVYSELKSVLLTLQMVGSGGLCEEFCAKIVKTIDAGVEECCLQMLRNKGTEKDVRFRGSKSKK